MPGPGPVRPGSEAKRTATRGQPRSCLAQSFERETLSYDGWSRASSGHLLGLLVHFAWWSHFGLTSRRPRAG
eukprot:2597906-Alexandrium_andersonii.AAC.1